MSGSGYGDAASLADAIALARSFKKADGPSKGRKRAKGRSQKLPPPYYPHPPAQSRRGGAGIVTPGALAAANAGVTRPAATRSPAPQSRMDRNPVTQKWATQGDIPALTGGGAMDFLKRLDSANGQMNGQHTTAPPKAAADGDAATQDIVPQDVSASKLLDTFYKLISEARDEPQKLQPSQVDELIDQMEQFSLKSATPEKAKPYTEKETHASQTDITQQQASDGCCNCKIVAKAAKGLSSSRFSTKDNTSNHTGKFTGIKRHEPTCPLLISTGSIPSSKNKENEPVN